VGIVKGSLSYLRFKVEGPVPSNYVEVFEQAIEIRRFVPLHPDGEDNESFGWVPMHRPYADDEPILNDHFLYGERVTLAYREDAISFPKAMVKDMVQQRLDEHREKNHVEASNQVRHAAEAAIMSEMRKRVLPKSKVVDVLWDLSRAELRFFARGKGVSERFVALFEQTFQVRLRQMTFAELAISADLSLRAKSMLETLTPQEIFKMSVRTEVN
jgi:recombination associated protein RdgC